MKKRNLLFIPFLFGMGIGFWGCNIMGGKNVQSYPAAPAVIDFNSDMGCTAISSQWGYAAAPDLALFEGNFAILSFTLDFDNQPSSQYYTASAISISETGPIRSLEFASGPVAVGDFTLPISDVGWNLWADGGSTSPFYNGTIFMGIACKDNAPNIRMVYNTQEPDSAGIKNLYLLAQPLSSSNTDVAKNYAFDLFSLFQNFGRDTTFLSNAGETSTYRYLKVNLKYLSKISDDGVPTYTTTGLSPMLLYMFQSQPADLF